MAKILFTSHRANFSKFNRPFMRWFREQGYEVHYASDGEEEVLDCDKNFNVCFNRSPYSMDNIKAYKQLKNIINSENYELIHCHTPMGGVVTRLAAKNARKKGTKVLYTAHGFHFYKGAPLKNWLFYYPVEKYLSKYTNCIITINEEDFELAKSKFKTAEIEKIDGVGVDLKRFKPVTMKEKENLKKQYGFSKKDFILIYVAEFTDGKNHKFIIKTLNEIKKAIPTLKVIFAGDGKNLKHDKKLVRELCLSETVLFKGYRMDVDKLYQLSDILISSSVREGLPINIIEGMATGLPIVCANIRGQVDVIINGINGYLYNLDDDNKFISSIIELYNDQNKRKKIGENNISYVEKYSLKNAIKNMERIYNKYL